MSVSAAASRNEELLNGSLPADRYGTLPDSEFRPFISIAIPTFRRPDGLRRAVESVLQQDFANWELVISDDEGLCGESSDVLSEYTRREPRIRAIENRRGRGQVENTNNAMLACRGHWIKLLHDDDWLAPGSLRTFARLAMAYPRAAFMTSTSHLVQDEGIRYRRGTQIFHYSGQELSGDMEN